jgi:hypothetical protein
VNDIDPEELDRARTIFSAFTDQQHAAVREVDQLMSELGFVIEILHLPKVDPAEDFDDGDDDDGMLAACRRGDYVCYRVTLHNDKIVLDETCSWSPPGIPDGRHDGLAPLGDCLASDVAEDFAQVLRAYAEK